MPIGSSGLTTNGHYRHISKIPVRVTTYGVDQTTERNYFNIQRGCAQRNAYLKNSISSHHFTLKSNYHGKNPYFRNQKSSNVYNEQIRPFSRAWRVNPSVQRNYKYNRFGEREEIGTMMPDPATGRKTEENETPRTKNLNLHQNEVI